MQTFAIVDPDWDDQTPVLETALDPADAVRRFYAGTLLEQPPELHAERHVERPGSASFGSIGDTRVTQFFVTAEDGAKYRIVFD